MDELSWTDDRDGSHPFATEAYFCFEGGGTMRTPTEAVIVEPGGFVVHPPGELHEYDDAKAVFDVPGT